MTKGKKGHECMVDVRLMTISLRLAWTHSAACVQEQVHMWQIENACESLLMCINSVHSPAGAGWGEETAWPLLSSTPASLACV